MRSLGVASRTDGDARRGAGGGRPVHLPEIHIARRSAIWEGTSRRTCARATAEVGAGGAEAPAGAPGATTTGTDSRQLPRPPTRRCRTPSSVRRRGEKAQQGRRSGCRARRVDARVHRRRAQVRARIPLALALRQIRRGASAGRGALRRRRRVHHRLATRPALPRTRARGERRQNIRGGDVRRRVRRPRRPRAMVRNAD
jgi:hypothetical protein